MPRKATIAPDNVFYKARMEAAKYNDGLVSRESAVSYHGIERTRLAKIEEDLLVPYPDEVVMMSLAYNAPELKPYYCSEYCPLGRDKQKIILQDLDRISLSALSSFRKIADAKEILLDIVSDGVISESEKPELNKLISVLDEVSTITQSLKLWAEKNIKL